MILSQATEANWQRLKSDSAQKLQHGANKTRSRRKIYPLEYLRNKEKGALHKALHYYGIILIFALGAGLGGVLSQTLGIRTIWISVALLLADCLMMRKAEG